MDNLIISLKNVVLALNGVEVKGKENMNALLGSIQTVEKVVSAIEKAKEEVKKEGTAHGNHDEQREDV